jgi:hypothetical protein
MKMRLVSALMRLYPNAWRTEYGAEMADMLLARPLTVRVCCDVVRSAMWQRMRAIEAPTWVGIALMMVTIAAIVANIIAPQPYVWSPGQSPSEKPALSERLALLQRPLHSEFYVLVLAGIGFWTAWRSNNRWPGWAAIRVSTIASLPLVLIGLLMLFGVLDFVELHPGQTPTTFQEHEILYTFYKGSQQIPGPAPIVMLLSPLLRLPGAWLWGVVGGGIAHWVSRARRRQTASV